MNTNMILLCHLCTKIYEICHIFKDRRNFKMRKESFTLAEVLIVLGIIGVIAAVILSAVVTKIKDKELKVAWKKEYSAFENANKMLLADNGGILSDDVITGLDDTLRDSYAQYMHVLKKCNRIESLGALQNSVGGTC